MKLAFVTVLLVLMLGPQVASASLETERARARAHAALERYDLPAARAGLQELEQLGAGADETALLRTLVAFYDGDHRGATEALARVEVGDDPFLADLKTTVEAAARIMDGASEWRSEHFVVRAPARREQVMVPLLLEVLESTYQAVGEDLGLFPDEPVLVELFPTSAQFAAGSGLPAEAQANDTVGLCRFNRLLLTSPMATPFGYPWADTICHEYTHLIVTRLGGGNVPVWLHEGIASFEQRRWRGETELFLDPFARRALVEALRADELVSFDEIGNCLSCIPGKERVRLAYTQVHTLVDHLIRERGMQSIRDTLEACRLGAPAEDAMAAAWGGTFEEVEADWGRTVSQRIGRVDLAVELVDLELDGPKLDGTTRSDSVLLETPEGIAHARLGDLLLDRGQPKAALLEYGRAEAALESISPSLACKQSYAYRDLGLPREALEALQRARELYPDFAPLAMNTALAWADLGEKKRVLDALEETAWLNPFDRRIYQVLLLVIDAEQNPDEYREAQRALEILDG